MESAIDGEQALGFSRLLGLVDGAAHESHGDGFCFVGAGIIESAVDQDGDGDQRGAFFTELQNR
jgi:hypothetical protein